MSSSTVSEKIYNDLEKNYNNALERVNSIESQIKLANEQLENSKKIFNDEMDKKNSLKNSYQTAFDQLLNFNSQSELKNKQLEIDIQKI